LRVLRKVEAIVREEMDAKGAQEVRMPAILPSEPWKVSGRWQAYAAEQLMFVLHDRHGRELGLGPTHEEVVTPLVDADYASYKDLPVNLYQVQWKYRDEARPRSGLVRAREFLMKDAYTFDRDVEGLRVAYAKMVDAYNRVFTRCGLDFRMVEADPGLIGGDVNHEFMAPSPIGEDLFVRCTDCDYAANVEAATCRPLVDAPVEDAPPVEEVSTPGRATIESVAELLGVPHERVLKCLLYRLGADVVAVLVPGNRDVNDGKLRRLFAPREVEMLTDADFEEAGLAKGYVGPQGLEGIEIVADPTVREHRSWVAGANRRDAHTTGVTLGRDFDVDRWEDVAGVLPGDRCPRCDTGTLEIDRAIEVGHTFQLGTRYSEPLKATFVDEDGIERPFVMGCYGIGVSRIVASVAEQHHDEAGLAWPRALAPFEVLVVPTNMDRGDVVDAAERIYEELRARDTEVALDDRAASAGVKFADADLVGYPLQVVVGARGLERGVVEVKVRSSGDRRELPLE
ncbi:MAG TPA: proline--tRNA ligase, partial [Actinomycetota bacterium]|nr:proline--tRNA ligase [Actinomycetota bacterium]